jgi:hypothetical protein
LGEKLQTGHAHKIIVILGTTVIELGSCCDDAKLGGGGVCPSNAGDGAGRVMRRDWWFDARQVEL